MNLMKKNLVLLLALIMCLSLTACGDSNDPDIVTDDVGRDWRVQGIVRDGGTITRDGEDTYVLVCVHKNDATFYYDSEDQTLFGYVDYPITLGDNVWDMFKGIDFADINGDGNSDVTIKFDNDGTELLMVWFWDTQSSQFVYQPEESQLGEDEPDESSGNDVPAFVYSIDQAGVYYANSMYEDTSYLVLDFDEGILIWGDEGTYYRMEDLQ